MASVPHGTWGRHDRRSTRRRAEEQPTPRALALLPFEQLGHGWYDTGVPSQPGAPVQPVPVERAACALHLHMTHDPRIVMPAKSEVLLATSKGPGLAQHDVPVLPD